jgi:membrane protein
MKGTSLTWQLISACGRNFVEDRALRLAAALAYYSIFALAPLLLIAVSVASLAFGEKALREELAGQLQGFMGPRAAEAVQEMLKAATLKAQGTFAMIIGIITLLVGATGFFIQLKDALNTIWQVEAKPGCAVKELVRDRLLSFLMVFVTGGLLLLSLFTTTAMAGVSAYTERLFDLPDVVWSSLNAVISIGVSTILFALIFKVLPDVRVPWKTVMMGAIITAVLFEIGKLALGFYLGRESTASGFGAAGSVILLLLWVYYASTILLFGAEMTQVWARLSNAPVSLSPFGIPARPIVGRYTITEAKAA